MISENHNDQWVYDLAAEHEVNRDGLYGPVTFDAVGLLDFANALLAVRQPVLPERDFAVWLNDRRMFPVSAVFHEIVVKYRATLSYAQSDAALRKLCNQLEGMKRRMRHTPGTGQNHSYLLAEDVDAYVQQARKALIAVGD